MSEEKENDYEINLKIDENLFKYKSIKKANIILNGHIELPQKYKFTMPRLSNKGIYVSAIGKAKNPKEDDVVFFWKAKHLNKKPILRLYGTSKIEFVQFFPDETTFFVIYENKPPEIYDFEKVIRKCEETEPKYKKVCNYSFSKKGDRLAVASDKDFVVYNVNTGKIYLQLLSDDRIKICRGKMVVLISDDFQITIIEIIKWNKNQPEKENNQNTKETYFENRHKIIKKFNLTPGSMDNIINSKISPDKKYIYLITKKG
jgi:WD40 repeat protein